MSEDRRYAPATLRNRDFILDVLRDLLPMTGVILESQAARAKMSSISSPPFSKPQAPARQNSSSDVEFADCDTASGNLTFTTTDMGAFNALNPVQPGGIHPKPGQTTGGEGKITGEEVQFDVPFSTPFILPADHYFFVRQVEVTDADGNFLWLSASRPIIGGTGSFVGDLQSWTREGGVKVTEARRHAA
jgi:hypothetical protein